MRKVLIAVSAVGAEMIAELTALATAHDIDLEVVNDDDPRVKERTFDSFNPVSVNLRRMDEPEFIDFLPLKERNPIGEIKGPPRSKRDRRK